MDETDEAAKLAEEQDRIRPVLAELKREEAEAVAQAQRPEATPAELRNIYERYCQRRAKRISLHRQLGYYWPPIREGANTLAEFLSAHPNTPLDILQVTVEWGDEGITGFLRNPLLSLLFLEEPDFLSKLERPQLTLPRLLRRHDLPLSLLRTLSVNDDPWIALEAQSHIGLLSEEDDNPEPVLDLSQLDQQVLEALERDRSTDHALYRELIELDVLPAPTSGPLPSPWEASKFQEPLAAIPADLVAQAVTEILKRTHLAPPQREAWLKAHADFDLKDPRLLMLDKKLFWVRLLLHPEMPDWVSTVCSKLWRSDLEDFVPESILLRRCILSHLPESDKVAFASDCRQNAIRTQFGGSYISSALPYLILREIGIAGVERLWGRDSASSTDDSDLDWLRFFTLALDSRFLLRLCIALHLNTLEQLARSTETEDVALPADLHEQLQNDPNRYVRAAARGELKNDQRA